MSLIAHIGNVPVEEWLPFLFPVLALYLYGRHWARRRRKAVDRLPRADEPLDDDAVELVISEWAKADHSELSREHLPLLYPPGPDGATATELAARFRSDPVKVEGLLEDLQELGYVDLEEGTQRDGRRAWLTAEGYDVVNITEEALVSSLATRQGERESC
jgi:predicted transcriptional regulator with HTH domain